MPNPPGPPLSEVDRMKRSSLESLFGAEKLPMPPMKPEDDLPKPLSRPIPSPTPNAWRKPEGILPASEAGPAHSVLIVRSQADSFQQGEVIRLFLTDGHKLKEVTIIPESER